MSNSSLSPLSSSRPPLYTPPPGPPRRSRSRSRQLRRNLVLFFIIAIVAAAFLSNNERIERMLPFIKKPAPPVTELHPVVKANTDELIALSARAGIEVVITDGFRSNEEQDALFDKGRAAEGAVVTYARGGQSFHNYGLAVDFAIKDAKGKIIWDLKYDGNGNDQADWLEVAAIAKRLGFSWGGDWEGFKDYPHLQMDFGYTIGELQRGFRPPAEER